MTRRTRGVLSAAAALTSLVLAIAGSPAASAHTSLISSSPQDGAVLPAAPTEVVLTFDQDLLPGADVMAVTDAQGNVIVTQPVEPDGPRVRLPWPTGLPAGEYQIGYRVVSGDGHPVDGAILITVGGSSSGAPPSSTPTPTNPASPQAEAQPPSEVGGAKVAQLSLGVAIVLVGVVGAAVVIARRRRTGRP